jgi:HAMP domain-containing protein
LRNGIAFDSTAVQAAQTGQTVVLDHLVSGDGGVPHTVAYVPIQSEAEGSPAVIMILVELEEIYSFQNSTLLNTILVFAALTTFALAIIYLNIFQTMIGPLNKLRTIAQTMTSGRYDERAQVKTTDEVGQLAAAANRPNAPIRSSRCSWQASRMNCARPSTPSLT